MLGARHAAMLLARLLCVSFASNAWADHGADPADELPLWLMLAVVFAVAAAVLGLRRLRGDRRSPRRGDDGES